MHFRAHPPVFSCCNILKMWRFVIVLLLLGLKHAEGMSLRFVPVFLERLPEVEVAVCHY